MGSFQGRLHASSVPMNTGDLSVEKPMDDMPSNENGKPSDKSRFLE